jgi:hypothetical protein
VTRIAYRARTMRIVLLALAISLFAAVGLSARAETSRAGGSHVARDVEEHLRELVRAFPQRDAERFIKVGGSSVVSRAFLHCFASTDVELGARHDLRPTLERLNRGRNSSFTRASIATAVGYNLRHVLGGRPPLVLREVRAMNPRFALVFMGPNDVMGKNPHVYERRLHAAVEMLLSQGVMPIVGSIPPRPRNKEIDRWVAAFNEATVRVAEARVIPYVDFHAAMVPVPGFGLARDGVHPNVYREGSKSKPCDFGAAGLAHGQNVRNLLVLDALDWLLRVADGVERDPKMAMRRE